MKRGIWIALLAAPMSPLACGSSSPDAANSPDAGSGGVGGGVETAGTLSTSAGSGGSSGAAAGSVGGVGAAGATNAGGTETARGGSGGNAGAQDLGGSAGASTTAGGGAGTSSGAGNAGQAGIAGAAGAAGTIGTWSGEFPTFTRHEIAEFTDGYYAAAMDVDGDGKPDVAALSSSRSQLVWYRNPNWEKFGITTGTQQFICMAPEDVDDDGDLDLAIASEFDMNDTNAGGTVYWVEAPEDPTTNQEWSLHAIDEVPTSHRLRWGDIDGDGKRELLDLPLFGIGSSAPEHVGPVELTAYAIPADPKGTWEPQVLDDTLLEVAHGLSVVDWNGDAAADILTASNAGVYLFQPSLSATPRQLGVGDDGARPDRGSSEVGLGSLGGDRFIATIEPWHGTDAVVYTPGASESDTWERHVIGSEFERGHALAVADFNGDGFDEIVGGDQNGGGALMIFRYVPSSKEWERIDIDMGGVAVIGVDISDIDGDGAPDIVAIGGSSNNLVWYENSR